MRDRVRTLVVRVALLGVLFAGLRAELPRGHAADACGESCTCQEQVESCCQPAPTTRVRLVAGCCCEGGGSILVQGPRWVLPQVPGASRARVEPPPWRAPSVRERTPRSCAPEPEIPPPRA